MKKPKALTILNEKQGRLGRKNHFEPRFEVAYTDGSSRQGSWTAFSPGLTFQRVGSVQDGPKVDFRAGKLRRRKGSKDGMLSCLWTYKESGAEVWAFSAIEVRGTLLGFQVASISYTLPPKGLAFSPMVVLDYSDGTHLRGSLASHRDVDIRLVKAIPGRGIRLLRDGRLRIDPSASTGIIDCRWRYVEAGFTQDCTSTLTLRSRNGSSRPKITCTPVFQDPPDDIQGFRITVIFKVQGPEPPKYTVHQRLRLFAAGFLDLGERGTRRAGEAEIDQFLRSLPVSGAKQLALGQQIDDWTHLKAPMGVVFADKKGFWVSDGVDKWWLFLNKRRGIQQWLLAFCLEAVTRLRHRETKRTLAATTSYVLYVPKGLHMPAASKDVPERWVKALQNEEVKLSESASTVFKLKLSHKHTP